MKTSRGPTLNNSIGIEDKLDVDLINDKFGRRHVCV